MPYIPPQPSGTMENAPSCAICSGPAYPGCDCEAERLKIAVAQAEKRAMESRMQQIRDWVIHHAREQILRSFEKMSNSRKQAHASFLQSLPFYALYVQYSGNPPLHPTVLQQLRSQVSEAHAQLKSGIDADWRVSVQQYPEVLDYYYSLVELRLPHEQTPGVTEPPLSASFNGAFDFPFGSPGKERKKKTYKHEATPIPIPIPTSPLQQRRRHKDERSYVVHGLPANMRHPPAPTPPIVGGGGYRAPPRYHS